eukprot:1162093-Pelagomonas_calceolata.AAC.1
MVQEAITDMLMCGGSKNGRDERLRLMEEVAYLYREGKGYIAVPACLPTVVEQLGRELWTGYLARNALLALVGWCPCGCSLTESLLKAEGVACGGTSALACASLLSHPYYACVPSSMTGHSIIPFTKSAFKLVLVSFSVFQKVRSLCLLTRTAEQKH